ncbi:MAG: glycosyltransferase, partial [Jatrophihabitantaceae bacterium]
MTAGPSHDPAVRDDGARPRFSIITAVHNVHRYLPEFIDSIEKQTYGLDRLEVMAVDDGSTDDSLVMLKEWAARRPGLV